MLTNSTNSSKRPAADSAHVLVRQCSPGQGLTQLPEGSRVLVIRLRSMGDTILLTPALRMLHEWRPDLRVSVLLDRPWDELLAGNPAIHQTIATGNKLGTLARIRREKFAAVINLHGGPSSAQLTRLSGAPLRIGLAQFRAHSAYNLLVPRMQDILPPTSAVSPLRFHTAEHAAAVFGWLGMPLRMIPAAQLYPSATARLSAQTRLQNQGMDRAAPYALMHPAGLYPSKRWSAQGFAEIGNYLMHEQKLRVILLGGPADTPLLEQIRDAMGGSALLAAGWPIGDMLALIEAATLFLGNDSGPAHAAAALGVPTAVIFGSSSSDLWSPWRAVASAVIQNPFACNPCPGDRCQEYGEPRCIQSVESSQVRRALEQLLAQRNRPKG